LANLAYRIKIALHHGAEQVWLTAIWQSRPKLKIVLFIKALVIIVSVNRIFDEERI